MNELVAHGSHRRQIKHDLELLGLLPADSAVRAELLLHIEEQLRLLLRDETTKKRSALDVVLGLVFLAAAAWLASYTVGGTWLWWPLVVLLLLLGVTGVAQGAIPQERDARGRVVKVRRRSQSG